jgi:hypothetical protein
MGAYQRARRRSGYLRTAFFSQCQHANIAGSVNSLRLKPRSPQHDRKILGVLPRQDFSLWGVDRDIPGNAEGEVVECAVSGPGAVEFDHLAVQKQVQGMFLRFHFRCTRSARASCLTATSFHSREVAIS